LHKKIWLAIICVRRLKLFSRAEMSEPTNYADHGWASSGIRYTW
jgi:hypothetical protein